MNDLKIITNQNKIEQKKSVKETKKKSSCMFTLHLTYTHGWLGRNVHTHNKHHTTHSTKLCAKFITNFPVH